MGCFAVYRDGEETIYYLLSDHLLFTLSGDGLCDVACVLLLKRDVCLACYAVVVVRTSSLCLNLQQIGTPSNIYAVVVVRTSSLCLSLRQIGTPSNIHFSLKIDVIFALKNRENT
jgi:hypothetical protein